MRACMRVGTTGEGVCACEDEFVMNKHLAAKKVQGKGKERKKVFFIHMNHTNGMLNPNSQITEEVLSKGFQIARYGMQFPL